MTEIAEGKLVKKTSIEVTAGQPSPAEARKWLGQQIAYPNYVGRNDDLDGQVKRYVQQLCERFYQQMSSVFERWETTWDAVNADPRWGEYEDDIHVPETQKKFRAKTARIYEALNDFDPIFECDGTRGDLPAWKAQVIGSYVYRSMELAKFRRLIQPVAGDLEICNIGAIKLQWEVKQGTVVDRSWEQVEKDGKLRWNDERRMRDAVTMGLKYRQVDPYRFLYDIDCGDLDSDDCLFVGDESFQFLHDLEAMARNGFFSRDALRKVRDGLKTPKDGLGASAEVPDLDGAPITMSTSDGAWVDIRRQSRSIAQQSVFGVTETANDNRPMKVRCREIWGWYDFQDGYDGITDPLGRRLRGPQKVVITTANGVPIQFRLNPHDKKFHPYAIGTINRSGHEAVAPANFEQVAVVNSQYDGFSSNVLRCAHLAVAPLATVTGEWPGDSLLAAKPGTVFPNVGELKPIQMAQLPGDVAYMDGKFRREVEETSGVLNVFESPQGTATETNRKVQEQQRAIRHSVIANGELWRQVAQKSLWMLAQFSTGPDRFKVAGKASQVLGTHFEITPDLMQEDVDFRFLGVDNLHVFGDRVAGMAQWTQRWGPLLPSRPDININALMRQDFELTVGRDRIQEVFPNEEPAWATWPQEQENEMLLRGLHVPVSTRDNDEDHIAKMEPLMRRLKEFPMYVRKQLLAHRQMHIEQHEKKAEEQKAAMKKSMLETQMMGGRPGVDKAPTPGGMEAMSGSDAQTPGVTPGPTQARTVSKPGRSGSGLSQQQRQSA